MLRRLYHTQPASFAFTPANLEWARGQITKYPEGRQASAIIPLLWRAQEQEGWLSKPAIEYVADMLGLAYIRALEVATFYFMFQLQPVGSVAHIQICGTTSCMICGAEDLIAVCKELISAHPHTPGADGKFSWEEVECMGACANAPMAQIGKDYYEDLTAGKLRDLIARFSTGEVPVPGPQNGRFAAEPISGLTSLKEYEAGRAKYNASAQLAVDIGETVRRIDGTEVALRMPWLGKGNDRPAEVPADKTVSNAEEKAARGLPEAVGEALAKGKPPVKVARPAGNAVAQPGQPTATAKAPVTPTTEAKARAAKAKVEGVTAPVKAAKPKALKAARKGKADDLKLIWGVGPALEALCHKLGFFHFDQIAAWTAEEIAWVDENLEGFKGRVSRDRWVAQAKVLAAGGSVEEAEKIGRGEG
jgi:NADH-quinone oxidoreductase subunit E